MCPLEHEWPATYKSVKPPKLNKNQIIQTISESNIIIFVYKSIIIIRLYELGFEPMTL